MSSLEIASEMPLWILYIFYIIIIAFTTVAVAGAAVNQPIPIDKAGFTTYANRILYSPSCLAHFSERPIPGIIDLNKFDQSRLADCFPLNVFGARLILDYITNDTTTSTITYINKGTYDISKPVCFSQPSACATLEHYVLVADASGILHRGRITFDMTLETRS